MKAKQMDITLKQNEIDQAIHRYVADTIGVNLTGKRLVINYSATRGAAGLIASLVIEDSSDVQIPGYTDRNADAVGINLGNTTSATVHTLPETKPTLVPVDTDEKEIVKPVPEVDEEKVVVDGSVVAEANDAEPAKSGLFAD